MTINIPRHIYIGQQGRPIQEPQKEHDGLPLPVNPDQGDPLLPDDEPGRSLPL